MTPEHNKLDEDIRKKCKVLAKKVLKYGTIKDIDKSLLMYCVFRAFDGPDQIKTARQAYRFFIDNGVSDDIAWVMSGLEKAVECRVE
jgi:hypothetical protein